MKIKLNYTVKLGKYDNNEDVFDWEVESTDEEIEKAYKKAIMTGEDFEDVPELETLRDQGYKEIEQVELEKLRNDQDDYFAIQCFKNDENPFEKGYKIEVYFADEEIIPEDEEIEEYLTEAMKAQDLEFTYAIMLEQNENYSGSLIEKAFEIAEEVGFQEFIEKNK